MYLLSEHEQLINQFYVPKLYHCIFLCRSFCRQSSYTTIHHELNREITNVALFPSYSAKVFNYVSGSPFRGRINNVIGRLNNGGFYGKWYRALYQARKRVFLHGTTRHRKITIRHLFIPFTILYVGLAISTIVFVREYGRTGAR